MEVKPAHIRYNINAENQSRQKGRKGMIETESTGLLTLYSDVRAAAVHWLWYPFIASGKITLLQGDPGDGKSTMMMRLIAELSTGGVTPDGCPLGRPQRIIYQCSEDGVADTIKPRLEQCGADCRNVAYINEEVYHDGSRNLYVG